jgi:hypothetical protein
VLAFAPVIAPYWPTDNVVLDSFYKVTPDRPRFFFASLPPRFVLWSASALAVVDAARRARSARDPSATTGPVRAR